MSKSAALALAANLASVAVLALNGVSVVLDVITEPFKGMR